MAKSNLQNYLGAGLAAARPLPATLTADIYGLMTAIYFATDSGEMSLLNPDGTPTWITAAVPTGTLGDAAYKNTGTIAGTVAAGDDSRIVGALQRAGGTMTGALVLNANPATNLEAATKQYVDSLITSSMPFKGSIDCSTNPNYPAAVAGDSYVVTVAGKIGGASGKIVDASDLIVCRVTNAGGDEASVGTSWFVLEHNLNGALLAANNLGDVASIVTAQANLQLTPGTYTQAHSAKLDAWASGDTPSAFTLGIVDAADAAGWRTALLLGDSSTRNVGTAAGTVAAGDDSRITGAVQAAGFTADIVPSADNTRDLGTAAARMKNLFTTQLYLGTGVQVTTRIGGSNLTAKNQTADLGSGAASMVARFSNDANGGRILFVKSRATAVNTWAATSTSDNLGEFSWAGTDGIQACESAKLRVLQDGSPGATYNSARMEVVVGNGTALVVPPRSGRMDQQS